MYSTLLWALIGTAVVAAVWIEAPVDWTHSNWRAWQPGAAQLVLDLSVHEPGLVLTLHRDSDWDSGCLELADACSRCYSASLQQDSPCSFAAVFVHGPGRVTALISVSKRPILLLPTGDGSVWAYNNNDELYWLRNAGSPSSMLHAVSLRVSVIIDAFAQPLISVSDALAAVHVTSVLYRHAIGLRLTPVRVDTLTWGQDAALLGAHPDQPGSVDGWVGDVLLEKLRVMQQLQQPLHAHEADVVLVLTGRVILGSAVEVDTRVSLAPDTPTDDGGGDGHDDDVTEDAGDVFDQRPEVFGLAKINMQPLCQSMHRAALLSARYGLPELLRVMPHELAHLLGAVHDDESGCVAELLMDASFADAYAFSQCSIDDMLAVNPRLAWSACEGIAA